MVKKKPSADLADITTDELLRELLGRVDAMIVFLANVNSEAVRIGMHGDSLVLRGVAESGIEDVRHRLTKKQSHSIEDAIKDLLDGAPRHGN